jgi:hypothetical protein
MPKFKDITGQRFGRLVAIRVVGRSTRGYRWRCQCDCGNSHTVTATRLRRNHTRSCGCLGKQGAPPKHGHAKRGRQHPLYSVWLGMRDRCNNPNNPAYKNYGSRGIQVCERWDNFPKFIVDVGERPSPRHVLDRIDNNGNYEPGNVKWSTPIESNNNKRLSKAISRSGVPGAYQVGHR